MIRSHRALLRHVQAFFLSDLIGVWDWGDVRVQEQELTPPAERREAGVGKFRERERLVFGPWDILICSSHDRPPLGELTLRHEGAVLIVGPLDPATWSEIGKCIRSYASQHRKAS